MAIIEQCNKCGRDFSECPYYNQEENLPCQFYQLPIDNSGFFSNFFSTKGRIGRVQYLVITLIGIALAFLISLYIGVLYAALTGDVDYDNTTSTVIGCIALLPLVVVMVLAGIKRCKDSGTDTWYAYIPAVCLFILNGILGILCIISIFYLFFQKGDEGINPHGTEPLKPYQPQIQWQ